MLDNALIRQKDLIISLINNGEYKEADKLLDFSEHLWQVCNYDYKTAELRERVRKGIMDEIANSTHWKQEKKWREMLA